MKWPEWIYHKKVSVLLSCIYSHECKVNSKLVLQGVLTRLDNFQGSIMHPKLVGTPCTLFYLETSTIIVTFLDHECFSLTVKGSRHAMAFLDFKDWTHVECNPTFLVQKLSHALSRYLPNISDY